MLFILYLVAFGFMVTLVTIILILTNSISIKKTINAEQEEIENDLFMNSREAVVTHIGKTHKFVFNSDYIIDYMGGDISVGDMPIGVTIVDPSWEWEFRTGKNYSGSGIRKPVAWIVVAKNHYAGLEPHVTLLTEDLIGFHTFDNSTDRDHEDAEYGSNHWGNSGTSNATRGLRPWLNSTDIHIKEGFYQSFSVDFKKAVNVTNLPNKNEDPFNRKSSISYSTSDRVFIPSATELGESIEKWDSYPIGSVFQYFSESEMHKQKQEWTNNGYRNSEYTFLGKRAAMDISRLRVGEIDCLREQGRVGLIVEQYWTRSPRIIKGGSYLITVNADGAFEAGIANYATRGVRPALNLKSSTLVSIIEN